MGDQQFGVDPVVATQVAQDVADIHSMGVETAIVIGGGNIFRGVAASARGMDRATADYMRSEGASCRERVEMSVVAGELNEEANYRPDGQDEIKFEAG